MSRIRTIKPDFFTSESVGALSWGARLTFAGLWTYVDDRGRAKDNPKAIRGALWPNDEETVSSANVVEFIDELVQHDMVCRYVADGSNHLHVINMKKHQTINRATASKLPPCPIHNAVPVAPPATSEALDGDSLNPHGGISEDSRNAQGGLTTGIGSGMEREVEEELEGEPADEPPAHAAKPRARATSAPEHFEITESLAKWASAKGLTPDALASQTECFLDHHRAKGNTFKDWNAAWRKWMNNAVEWSKPNTRNPVPQQRGQPPAYANTGNTLDFDEDL